MSGLEELILARQRSRRNQLRNRSRIRGPRERRYFHRVARLRCFGRIQSRVPRKRGARHRRRHGLIPVRVVVNKSTVPVGSGTWWRSGAGRHSHAHPDLADRSSSAWPVTRSFSRRLAIHVLPLSGTCGGGPTIRLLFKRCGNLRAFDRAAVQCPVLCTPPVDAAIRNRSDSDGRDDYHQRRNDQILG